MTNQTESSMIFYNRKGHNHDGENSTKVDFSEYSETDIQPIIDLLKLNDTITTQTTSSSTLDSIYYHKSGNVTVTSGVVASKIFQYACTSIMIVCTLGTVATTSTVVTIYKDGGAVGTVTIPAGQGLPPTPVRKTLTVAFDGSTNGVSAKVTTAGSGGKELGVEIYAVP